MKRLCISGILLIQAASAEEPNQSVYKQARQVAMHYENNLKKRTLHNKTAYIPPQCYTKTRDASGALHNPCYVCHTQSRRPNFINDQDLQQAYLFPLYARTNPWRSLFKERQQDIAADDQAIIDYVRTDNYFAPDGTIHIAEKLRQVPSAWDYNDNGQWDGYVPDAYFSFDQAGFDHRPDGSYTGWRAFAYYPFPGSFWPTNGSTDDVLIRLPASFQTNSKGEFDLAVYQTNLAIVEALLKERDITIEPVDERLMGVVDLDDNGKIGTAKKIRYAWAPLKKQYMWYVGKALEEQKAGIRHLAAGLFPEGTEFLHTVRYVDVDQQGNNRLSPRMKEVRYARKNYWVNYADLERNAAQEIKEDYDFPDRLHTIRGNSETGISNDQGWIFAGFIEDAQGGLRPQSYQELNYCYGCHGHIGATRDGIFSFQRKLDGRLPQHGWFHWTQHGLQGIPERIRSDGEPEYSYYLKQNHAGDEFRANREIIDKFFDRQGAPVAEMFARLRNDISVLLFASPQRALQLNRSYQLIVREQRFDEGRDTLISPPANVHRKLAEDESTGIDTVLRGD